MSGVSCGSRRNRHVRGRGAHVRQGLALDLTECQGSHTGYRMPTYEYACKACGHEWEQTQRITEPPLEVCPVCGKSTAHRLISAGTNFILKGSGWYSDLYASPKPSTDSSEKKDPSEKSEKKDASDKRTEKSDASTAAGSETPAKSPAKPASTESASTTPSKKPSPKPSTPAVPSS
jgi:putative FmdB family regulatory protein